MKFWTEVKCYTCSRVCGEAPGRCEHMGTVEELRRVLPGPFCTLVDTEFRCSRCGGLVYPGETRSSYRAERSEPAVPRRHRSARARPTASCVA